MVHVVTPMPPGYGGQAGKPPGWQDTPSQVRPGDQGNGTGEKPPHYESFDPRGAFTIPNNFWGFAMLMWGLK